MSTITVQRENKRTNKLKPVTIPQSYKAPVFQLSAWDFTSAGTFPGPDFSHIQVFDSN